MKKEIEQQNVEGKVSYYLHKRNMSICCETSTMTETLARKLLKSTDWLMDEHVFQNNGLRELGWCSHYTLDMRTYNYHKNKHCECLLESFLNYFINWGTMQTLTGEIIFLKNILRK